MTYHSETLSEKEIKEIKEYGTLISTKIERSRDMIGERHVSIIKYNNNYYQFSYNNISKITSVTKIIM